MTRSNRGMGSLQMIGDEKEAVIPGVDSFAARAVEGRRAALEQLASSSDTVGSARAVTYLRTARNHPDETTAVAYQREGCRRIAERYGLTVVREYVDAGRPGRLDQQIELLHLLGDLSQKRDVVAVIVWDYARLGRSMEQLEQVTHHIHACGAEIVTITGMEAAERFIQEHGSGALSAAEEATTALSHVFGELWHQDRSEQAKRGWEKRRKRAKHDEDESEGKGEQPLKKDGGE